MAIDSRDALAAPEDQVGADRNLAVARRPSDRRRKVLMITFHYPPSNTSSGGLRPLKFGKYLREFGWDTCVLTVPAGCHESIDPALVQEIPRWVSVSRARCFDAKTALAIRGRYPAFLAVPDRYVSWLPFGAREGTRTVRREGVTALFSTSPIPTAHLIALTVKAATGLPWIADFRDPWVETEGSEVHRPFRQAVESWLERQVVRRADRILVTTREFAEFFRLRYGVAVAAKTCAVYNGYDEDDFEDLVPELDEGGGVALVHAGLLDASYRNPRPLLQAVRQCIDQGALPKHFCVRFIGGGAYAASDALARTISELRLNDAVQIVGRIPYRRALAALAGASVLLLMQGGDDTRMLIPAKAFEYLRTGRPILAAAPLDSATARLVREFAGGFVADPNEPAALAQALAASFDAWSRGARSFDRMSEGLARYSRHAAAAELASILEGITKS